jgi:hypothetical protein
MKFAIKSSRLSLAEKASIAGIEVANKKTSSTSATRGNVTHALKHALNLFDSGLSSSDDETTPLERPQKHSREIPLSEDVAKSLAVKGIFE